MQKSGFKLPISTRNSSETEAAETQAGKQRGAAAWERGSGTCGETLAGTEWAGGAAALARALRPRMVIPAFCRLVTTCCLLRAASFDNFAAGLVVFSVFLYFIGTTPAM